MKDLLCKSLLSQCILYVSWRRYIFPFVSGSKPKVGLIILDYSEIFKCLKECILLRENLDFIFYKRQSKMNVSLCTGNLKWNIKIRFITHHPVFHFWNSICAVYLCDRQCFNSVLIGLPLSTANLKDCLNLKLGGNRKMARRKGRLI